MKKILPGDWQNKQSNQENSETTDLISASIIHDLPYLYRRMKLIIHSQFEINNFSVISFSWQISIINVCLRFIVVT